MTTLDQRPEPFHVKPPRRKKARRRIAFVAGLIGVVAVGAGANALAQRSRAVPFVALAPAPITAMKDWSPVAVKRQVAEIFGNKFVVQDDSGRALVEIGRHGEGGNLVAKSETVTVQGRFEHGFIHAVTIQHADGHNDVVAPPGPPPPPPTVPTPDRIEADPGRETRKPVRVRRTGSCASWEPRATPDERTSCSCTAIPTVEPATLWSRFRPARRNSSPFRPRAGRR